MITSVSDLHLWMQALAKGRVLPKKAVKKLFDPGPGNYACGWYVAKTKEGRLAISHGGTAPGFQSYIRHFPEEDVLVLVTCNREGMHWQVTWGLSALMLGEDAQVPPPPETEDWSDEQLEALAGVYEAEDMGRLVVERNGGALRIGAEGSGAIALLSGSKPDSDQDDFAWERSRAVEIIVGLLAGDTEPIERDILPTIPRTWPSTLLTRIWPAHIEKHGQVSSFEEIGGLRDARSGRVRVWVRMRHPEGSSTVEVAFVERKLNIFDLQARRFPIERAYAPIGKQRFATYAFSSEEFPELAIEADGVGKTVLTVALGRRRYEFVRSGR